MSDSVRPHRRQPTRLPITGILQARTLEWVAISFSNAWKWKMKVKSLSHVWLCATPWTAAHQPPPSMGFSREEYWSGMALPSPTIPLMQRPWKSLKFVSSPDWLGPSPKSKGRDETCTCIFTHMSVTPKPVIYSLHVTNPRIKRGRIQLQTCFRNLAFDKNGLRANRIIWEVRKKCF